MRRVRAIPVAALLALAGCGAVGAVRTSQSARIKHLTAFHPRAARVAASKPPQALVTAESENRLLVVDLPSGRVARQVTLPPDPEDLTAVARGGVVVVVSSRAGTVSLLDRATLRTVKVLRGFDFPHIAALSPDGQHAYVTDDTRGTLIVISLAERTVTSTVPVGVGAHHLSFSPDQHRLWVALGESARLIAILDTTDLGHPRLIGHFSPGFPAHDLSFTPDGRGVWITSAVGPAATAFGAQDHRLLFRVPAGPPPQHLVFNGRYAYVTSGYGGMIEQVVTASGHILRRATAPYGSFELDAADGYVATSSLLRGTLAVYSPQLKLLHVLTLAPATREVVISRP
jgi:YVTN family beta-propeller protein